MRLTAAQLRRIIKEEVENVTEAGDMYNPGVEPGVRGQQSLDAPSAYNQVLDMAMELSAALADLKSKHKVRGADRVIALYNGALVELENLESGITRNADLATPGGAERDALRRAVNGVVRIVDAPGKPAAAALESAIDKMTLALEDADAPVDVADLLDAAEMVQNGDLRYNDVEFTEPLFALYDALA